MLKNLMALVAVMFVTLALSNVAVAEHGNVPADQLAQFGLGNMETLTDAQGEQIRGTGFYYGHHWFFHFHGFHGHHGKHHGLFLHHHFLGHKHGFHGHVGHGQGRHFGGYLTHGIGFHRFLHVITGGHGHHHHD